MKEHHLITVYQYIFTFKEYGTEWTVEIHNLKQLIL